MLRRSSDFDKYPSESWSNKKGNKNTHRDEPPVLETNVPETQEMLKSKENIECILRKRERQECTYIENIPIAVLELMRPLAQSDGKKT